MTHLPGEFQAGASITAHDYDNIISNLNNIYGIGTGTSGYGSVGSPAADFPSKSSGDLIENEDWRTLRDAWEAVADHQGISLTDPLPPDANLEGSEDPSADIVGFAPGTPKFANFDSPQNIFDITANKDSSAGEALWSVDTIGTSTRTTQWTTQIEHRFILTFDTQDDARAYFNTGGEIRISASRTGGSLTDQNTAWTNMLLLYSPVIFGSTEYFGLTTAFATIFTGEDTTGGPYDTPNPIKWLIQAQSNDAAGPRGGKGNIITIRTVFFDQHIAGPFPYDPPEFVDGTFTSTVQAKYADDIFQKSAPSYELAEVVPGVPYDLIGS